MRNAVRFRVVYVIVLALVGSTLHAGPSKSAEIPNALPLVIRVTPAFGAYPRNLAVPITTPERRVISRINREIKDLGSFTPQTLQLITWYVEKGSEASPTLDLARAALIASQQIFETFEVYDGQATSIVVGRTQKFLSDTVTALGCFPNLTSTFGQHLMGSSLCNDRVITVNLSGYLFLESMRPVLQGDETRAEPSLARTSYLVVDRNASVLAHEWAHSVRTRIAGGLVPDGEPTWMSEGFAEMVSGLARVKAFGPDLSFADMHAMKVRLFADWPNRCPSDLNVYAAPSVRLGGCEYILGFIAVELLISEFGGLGKLLELYQEVTRFENFIDTFEAVYGLSLDEFERVANQYIKQVAILGFGAKFRANPSGRVVLLSKY